MNQFCLYRLKIEWSDNPSLFGDGEKNPGNIILSAIKEKPSCEIRKGQEWHIGNIEKIGKEKVFLALGKVTKATHEFYDEEKGDFLEKDLDEAPHTYVAIDLNLQVCAIAKKSKIAPKVNTIARNFSRVLNASQKAELNHLTFTLNAILDPNEFLQLIKNAKYITKFEMALSPPNPPDVEELFHKPLEKFLHEVKGNQGKVSVGGKNLNKDILEGLTRSAVSSGSEVKARIQSEDDPKPVPKNLGENLIIVECDELTTDEEKRRLLAAVEKAYHRVRNGEH